jgi:multidrug transporter EmrE-like cation transporter
MLATGLALGAAFLHATWNLLLKSAPDADRDLSSWGIFLTGGLLVLPIAVALGGPGAASVPWLALSALIHIGYVTGLVAAYRHGDFSLAYPLARGSGAVVAAIGGSLLLGDRLPAPAWIAIVVVAAGLVSLVGREVTGTTVRDALLTGLAIGAYTLADARGARVSPNPVAYGLITTSAAATAISAAFLVRGRGPALVRAFPHQWRRWTLGGMCTAVSYAMVMVATRHAEVGYVAMLRESSVVLGALIGWRVLKEPMGGRRLAASAVVLAGLIGLVLARTV